MLWEWWSNWLRGMEKVEVEGYKWWGANRVVQKKAKRGSGGVGVLVRNDVWQRVVVMEEESDERMVWLRVRSVGEGNDRYVGIVYGECEGVDSEEGQDWWERVEGKIVAFRRRGKVMVMGDFTARTGKELGGNGEEVVNSNGENGWFGGKTGNGSGECDK